MKDCKLIIFDLWDTIAYFEDRSEGLMAMLGDDKFTTVKNLFNSWHTINKDEQWFVADLEERIKLDESEITAVKQWALYRKIGLYPDSLEILAWLKSKNKNTALASNTASLVKKDLAKLDIEKYFDKMFLSFELGMEKSKEFYEKILEYFHIRGEESLMIGDSLEKDVFIPRGLGINTLLLDRDDSIEYRNKISNLTELKNLIACSGAEGGS